MNANLLVSIIIPAYNAEQTIAECIDSVINQTYKSIEIIVIDDGSTDSTTEIMKSNYPDIKYIKILHNGSPGYVRNRGIEHAKGFYIGFIDADDYWDTTVVEELLRAFQRNPKAMLSYGTLTYSGGKHDGESVHTLRTPYEGHVFSRLIQKNFIQMHPALLKRSILAKTGSFDEALNVDIAEDYDLWLRITYHYPVVYAGNARGYYRIAPNSQFHSIDLIKRNKDILKVLFKIKRKFKLHHWALYKRLAVLYETLGRHYLTNQQIFSSLGSYLCCAWYAVCFILTRSNDDLTSSNQEGA